MSSDLSKMTFMIAALVGALALFVAGFIVALEVRETAASPAAASNGGSCYTNWNANTCAAGYTAVSTGVWTQVFGRVTLYDYHVGTLICAEEKPLSGGGDAMFWSDVSITSSDGNHDIDREPCAICCASGAAGGGIAEYPDVAGTGDDGLPRNAIIIAAVTGLIAFGAGAFYARKRWAR